MSKFKFVDCLAVVFIAVAVYLIAVVPVLVFAEDYIHLTDKGSELMAYIYMGSPYVLMLDVLLFLREKAII